MKQAAVIEGGSDGEAENHTAVSDSAVASRKAVEVVLERASGDNVVLSNASMRRQPDGSFVVSTTPATSAVAAVAVLSEGAEPAEILALIAASRGGAPRNRQKFDTVYGAAAAGEVGSTGVPSGCAPTVAAVVAKDELGAPPMTARGSSKDSPTEPAEKSLKLSAEPPAVPNPAAPKRDDSVTLLPSVPGGAAPGKAAAPPGAKSVVPAAPAKHQTPRVRFTSMLSFAALFCFVRILRQVILLQSIFNLFRSFLIILSISCFATGRP